jgi:hypothetical protein
MKKFLSWTLFVIILCCGCFIYFRYYYTYSEGNRAGLLQKFSNRGNIFKTFEGEMVLSSVESRKDVAIASEKFLFTVLDKEVAQKLVELEGHFVIIHYKSTHGRLFWRGDTNYFVDDVKQAD